MHSHFGALRMLCASALALALLVGVATPGDAVATVRLAGSVASVLSLSSGSPAGGGASAIIVSDSGTGAGVSPAPLDSEDFSSSIDFGDLSAGNGSPAIAALGLRVRSNCNYKLTMSKPNFSATNLHYKGRNISGSTDGGTFITVSAGPNPIGGADANVSGTQIRLPGNGVPLSLVTSGGVNSESTLVATGTKASRRGGPTSSGNGIDIPVSFTVPTGMELGPVDGGTQGTFTATVQFGIFSGL
jgi:hypothetical protein